MTNPLPNSKMDNKDFIEIMSKSFAEVLKNCRLKQGLTQHDLSENSGLSLRMISELERGKTQPTLASLFKLAHALQIPADALIEKLIEQIDST